MKAEDLKAGTWKGSWVPKLDHPSLTPEQAEMLSPMMNAKILLAISEKAYRVSDEWNRLLPDYEFTGAEEFLTKAWSDKP